MKRYDSYKDSGVKWLGEIPSHWDVRKMKYTFSERSQKGYPNLPLLAATQTHGVIKKEKFENRTVEATKGLETLKLVEEGDFVISLRSFQGGIELCHDRGIISPAYTILKSQAITPFYFKHLGKSPIFIQLLKSMVTGIREGQNIDYGKLRDNLLPIPPLKEQEAIANYLDSITSKIDEAIAHQQKMIDLLNERKQIIINQAVTKGLDPNVKMKPSGIDWIGDIPEHWYFLPGKTLYYENKLKNKDGKEKNVLSLSYGKIIKKKELVEGLQPENYSGYQIVDQGYIIIRCTDLQNDHTSLRTGLVKEHGIITGAYLGLIPKGNITPTYLQLFFHVFDISKEIYRYGSGTRQSLSWDDFKNLPILVPSIKEQMNVCEFVEDFENKIDNQINLIRRQISLLQERKQIIINDVVTGKVKVI